MKYTPAILAALSMGAATAFAGPAPVYTGKEAPPPPPVVDPCAGPISYNNIELLYAHTNWDGPDDGDGAILRVEYSPWQNWYLVAGAEFTEYEFGPLDVHDGEEWLLNAGIGYYFPITDNIHFATDAGVLWNEWDEDYATTPPTSASHSDTGWYARPHFRGKWGCFTLHIGAIYQDICWRSSYDEVWSGFASVYYQLSQSWDITGGVQHNDSGDTKWTAGARFRF